MKKNIAIRLTNVSKKYFIHHEKPTLAERVLNGKSESFDALKNINLTIHKGERVGIIGPNGCGKTTILKLITEIATPTGGTVKTDGKIVSLIDLEGGFHPDLSGIKNIYLNGMILGMSKTEIDDNLDEIIKFADIGKFIDVPLFTYSSGMKLRLGFAIAMTRDPDILILDENISVGDRNFSDVAYKKIEAFLNSGKTLILVSHNMLLIKLFCKRVIWISNGMIKKDGDTRSVLPKYL